MEALAPNLWHLQFPLKLLGANMQRHVTIIRLESGAIVVHSTGPFTPQDVTEIQALGRVGWITDVMLRHETFSRHGKACFPQATFLGPEGFSKEAGFAVQPLLPAPLEWGQELQMALLDGMPSVKEHAFFHRPSRTLIVADLLFNPDPAESGWTRFLMAMTGGRKNGPGMSRALRLSVRDKAAFTRSLAAVRAWDFDRIIVGHGSIVEHGGKAQFEEAMRQAGY